MSAPTSVPLHISLPDSLRHSVEALVRREGISLDQFIASAMAEKLAAWEGLEHLQKEAKQGQLKDLKYFLAAVPDVEPDESDRLPKTRSPI